MNSALQCLPATYRRRRRTLTVVLVTTLTTMLYTTSQLFNNVVTSDIFVPQVFPEGVALRPSTGSVKPIDDPSVNLGDTVSADTPMLYNTAQRPLFHAAGTTPLLTNLPEHLIPTVSNRRRLLFIGDVHGQRRPLQRLLTKASYNPTTDHLIFLGNLPGPRPGSTTDSISLLNFAIFRNATLLRGPAEDRLILASPSYIATTASGQTAIARANHTASAPAPADAPDFLWAPGSDEDEADGLEQGHFAHGDHAERALASALMQQHLDFLSTTHAILKIPMPAGIPPLAAVHGGLVPGIPLAHQDPNVVMNLKALQYPVEQARQDDAVAAIDEIVEELQNLDPPRSFGRRTYEKMVRAEFAKITRPEDRDLVVPTDFIEVGGEATDTWMDVWNARAHGFEAEERLMIVFGNGAGKGLEEGKWTVGMDMGCGKGEKLGGLVVDITESGMRREVVTVGCGWWS